MNTTIAFNYQQTKDYALKLFDTSTGGYLQEKKVEALLILIGLDTGLRVTDMLNLKFDAIVKEDFKPRLHAYISKKKRSEVKAITSTTVGLIEVYKQWCRLQHGTASEFIFMNYTNKKLYTRQWAHKRLNKANDKGELGKKVKVAGAHSLRRTAANNVYKQTNDLRIAQFVLGHDRISQTEHYLKIDEERALDKLDRIYN